MKEKVCDRPASREVAATKNEIFSFFDMIRLSKYYNMILDLLIYQLFPSVVLKCSGLNIKYTFPPVGFDQ